MINKMLFVFGIVAISALCSCSPTDSPKKVIQKEKKKVPAETQIMKIAKNLVRDKGNLNQCYNTRFKPDDKGIPILVWAVSKSDVDAVKILLENGADPNVKLMARSSDTVLFEGSPGVDLDPENTKIYKDRRMNTTKICELLIKAGANVKHANKIGETPLHNAATKGREDICALLIANGADVNAADKIGTTPLHKGAKYGYWKVVEVLVKNKADVNVRNKLNQSPLILANQRCDQDLHNQIRKDLPGAYPNSDYDLVIKILTSAGGR